MTFKEVTEKLGIEEYCERIFHSNSHGELMHLSDYFMFLERIGDDEHKKIFFKAVFMTAVEFAEENWNRPESVFQHMPKMFQEMCGKQ